MLELYRSGDFEKLKPYEGQLQAMGVPALITTLESGISRLNRCAAATGTTGSFADDEPARCAREIVAFLDDLP
jgi:hypothetical protein